MEQSLAADKYEFPTARASSAAFVYKNQLMLWGGVTQRIFGEDDGRFIVNIDLPDADLKEAMLEIFDLESFEWSRQATHGNIPYVGYSFSFTLAGDFLFLFGGFTDVDYFDDLYQLNLKKFTWKKLPKKKGPSPLTFSGMLAHGDSVLVVGGSGPKPLTDSKHGGTFVDDQSFNHVFQTGWNNCIFKFDTKSELWKEMGSSGNRPPPCDSFSLTMIDPHRALLFGGKKEKFSKQYFNHVYIWDLESLHWEGPYGPKSPDQKWPAPRCVHSAACLVDPQLEVARKEQKVIVFWGSGFEALHVPDIWILDVPHMSWKELKLKFRPRKQHMSCSFHVQERQTDVFVFGGNKQRKSKFERHVMTDLMIFRFGSVQRLEELCKLVIRQHRTLSEHSLARLPWKIVKAISSDQSDYEIVYPTASDFN